MRCAQAASLYCTNGKGIYRCATSLQTTTKTQWNRAALWNSISCAFLLSLLSCCIGAGLLLRCAPLSLLLLYSTIYLFIYLFDDMERVRVDEHTCALVFCDEECVRVCGVLHVHVCSDSRGGKRVSLATMLRRHPRTIRDLQHRLNYAVVHARMCLDIEECFVRIHLLAP